MSTRAQRRADRKAAAANRVALQFIRLDRVAESWGTSSRGLAAVVRDMNDRERRQLAEMADDAVRSR